MKYLTFIFSCILILGCQTTPSNFDKKENQTAQIDSNIAKRILTLLERVEAENNEYNLSPNHIFLKYLLTKDSSKLDQVERLLVQNETVLGSIEEKEKTLSFIEEKNIENYAKNIKNGFVIRLNYWEAFTWNGVPVITIINTEKGTLYKRKRYEMDNKCNPMFGNKPMTKDCFTIIENFQDTLTKDEFLNLKHLISTTNLYTTGSNYEKEKYKYMDGDWFKIEVLQKYEGDIVDKFSVQRQSAGERSPLKVVGNYIIKLRNKVSR